MNIKDRQIIFVMVLLICFSFNACKIMYETDPFQLDCSNLQAGLIESDLEMVCEEISKLLQDLNPTKTPSDDIGHEENLDIVIERINSICDNVRTELICYACINTGIRQSELKLFTDSSGVEISRILDIETPENEILNCVSMH